MKGTELNLAHKEMRDGPRYALSLSAPTQIYLVGGAKKRKRKLSFETLRYLLFDMVDA
jgi:hypothetical protein